MSARENLTLGRPDASDDDIDAGARDRPGRLRLRPAVGPRHPDRRAGHVAVRRPAPAARAGPRGARPAADPGARRHAVRARRAHRGAGRGGAAPGAGRRHRASSSPTAPRRCCSPTGSRCSRTARSPTSATHRELLADRAGLPRPARRRRRRRGRLEPRGGRPRDHRHDAPSDAGRRDHAWRGVGRGRRRRGRRADDRRHARRPARGGCCATLLRPHKRAHPGAARGRRGRERRPALDPVPRQGGHRHGHPADRRPTTTSSRCSSIVGARAGGHADPGRRPPAVPRAVRTGRPGRALRAAPPGVRALPGAVPGVPRRLHLRPGDLAADLRHRRDLRAARDRLRRAGHRRADPGRHRGAAARPRREARAWSRCSASRSWPG